MKIKSLLLGSAAALVAVSGARAADAVVIPEPEAVEYVRVCDMYGAGFYYIPGTETCLSIGGFVRYEMNFDNSGSDAISDPVEDAGFIDNDDDWGKDVEFQLWFDARNETELGTLRSFIRLGADQRPRGNAVTLQRAFIQLGGLTMGKQLTYWDWGFGADGDSLVNYGPGALGMVAYTVNAGGFAWTLALEEDENGNYVPDVVFDMNGSIGALGLHGGLVYNESAEAFGGKIAAAYDFGAATLQVGYQYSDDSALGMEYMAAFEHVLGADVSADLTDKLSARAGFTYGLNDVAGLDGYSVGAGVNYALVSGFEIDARITYTDGDLGNAAGNDMWSGRIRFTRSF